MKNSSYAIALRCCYRRFIPLLRIFLYQLFLRAIALLPLTAVFFFRKPISFPVYVVITIAFYLFVVFPERFSAALRLTRMVRIGSSRTLHSSPYRTRLIAGFLRILLALPWTIPCFFLAYRTYQYIAVFPATRFTADFTWIGRLFYPSSDALYCFYHGTILYFCFLIAALLLMLYGWFRNVPFDFQFVGTIRLKTAFKLACMVRRRCRLRLLGNALVHSLLLLPSFAAPLFLLFQKLRPMLTGRAMEDLQLLYLFVKTDALPDLTLLLAAFSFLILYLPFLSFRKLHNAAVVVNCYDSKR